MVVTTRVLGLLSNYTFLARTYTAEKFKLFYVIRGNSYLTNRHACRAFLKEDREGLKWELGLAYFRLGKWDWGYWD